MIGVQTKVRTNKDAAQAVSDGVRKRLFDAADRGFEVSQDRVAIDTSQLQQSGVPPTEQQDGSIVWGYNAEYAKHVEHGTAPHWPPIKPLKGWARRVLGDESAAYAVQQKIAKEGTPAQPFVAPGIDAMKAELRARGISPAIEDNL